MRLWHLERTSPCLEALRYVMERRGGAVCAAVDPVARAEKGLRVGEPLGEDQAWMDHLAGLGDRDSEVLNAGERVLQVDCEEMRATTRSRMWSP